MKRLALSVAVSMLVLAAVEACHKRPPPAMGAGVEPPDAGVQGTAAAQGPTAEKECDVERILIRFLESKPQSPYYRGFALEYFTSFSLRREQADLKDHLFAGWASADAGPPVLHVDAFRDKEVCNLQLTPVYPAAEERLEDVQLYEVRFKGRDLCPDQPSDLIDLKPERAAKVKKHKGRAIAVPGYWEGGNWKTGDGTRFTLSCLSGVVAKCVVWEYLPWKQRAELHRTCVHAARAKYLEDRDSSFTCTNTLIDVFDKHGIQPKGADDAGFQFESLWGPDGLICMAHSRWTGCDTELKDVTMSPDGCQEPGALPQTWRDGGLIAIRSSPARRTVAGVCPSQPDAGCPAY